MSFLSLQDGLHRLDVIKHWADVAERDRDFVLAAEYQLEAERLQIELGLGSRSIWDTDGSRAYHHKRPRRRNFGASDTYGQPTSAIEQVVEATEADMRVTSARWAREECYQNVEEERQGGLMRRDVAMLYRAQEQLVKRREEKAAQIAVQQLPYAGEDGDGLQEQGVHAHTEHAESAMRMVVQERARREEYQRHMKEAARAAFFVPGMAVEEPNEASVVAQKGRDDAARQCWRKARGVLRGEEDVEHAMGSLILGRTLQSQRHSPHPDTLYSTRPITEMQHEVSLILTNSR